MAGNDLPKCEANYAPLTPITFLQRTAAVYPDRDSLIYGERRFTWAETLERCHRLASALRQHSILEGDTVVVVAPNVPATYELHFAVPMAGAVINAINMRLNAQTIAVILCHSEAKLVFVDTEFLPVIQEALRIRSTIQPSEGVVEPLLVHVEDKTCGEVPGIRAGEFNHLLEYEAFLGGGDPNFSNCWPKDEWDAIAINYTSGTTAHPKGVVYHHRGAYLHALVTALDWGMPTGPVYLWTLPMFHANGWCFTWTVAALAGTNICLRNVTSKGIFAALDEHRVTHLCGAPVVLTLMANAPEHERKPIKHKVHIMTGAAPPAAALLAKMEAHGFSLTHAYGLTETYGPVVSCVWKDEWDSLALEERARIKARQGVGNLAISGMDVLDPTTMRPVPRDGETIGEIMIKGHVIMKGYLKDQTATEDAFRGGWFHTGDMHSLCYISSHLIQFPGPLGATEKVYLLSTSDGCPCIQYYEHVCSEDLGVMNSDGYVQLKDRSKDIIISGGENISSIEIESVLYRHPQILDAAVVACPDDYWGETPCAFVTVKSYSDSNVATDVVTEKSIIAHCRKHLAHYKVPRTVIFDTLPKTITGKVQKNILRDRARKLGSMSAPMASKL